MAGQRQGAMLRTAGRSVITNQAAKVFPDIRNTCESTHMTDIIVRTDLAPLIAEVATLSARIEALSDLLTGLAAQIMTRITIADRPMPNSPPCASPKPYERQSGISPHTDAENRLATLQDAPATVVSKPHPHPAAPTMRSPERLAILEREYPAGSLWRDIIAQMNLCSGPTIPLDEAGRLFIRRWANDRAIKFGGNTGRPNTAANPTFASAVKLTPLKANPVPPSAPKQETAWSEERRQFMRAWFPVEPNLDLIWEKLNTIAGLRLTRDQVLSAGAAMGLRRPAAEPPFPLSQHGTRCDVDWLTVANWCNDKGMRAFNGDMAPVNEARRRLNLVPWVLTQPFGPGSTPSTLPPLPSDQSAP